MCFRKQLIPTFLSETATVAEELDCFCLSGSKVIFSIHTQYWERYFKSVIKVYSSSFCRG